MKFSLETKGLGAQGSPHCISTRLDLFSFLYFEGEKQITHLTLGEESQAPA